MKEQNMPWDTPNDMEKYLQPNRLVDLRSSTVRETADRLMQGSATPREAAVCIYNFVRDGIKFGYNRRDDITASEVLHDGYGQCNTKSVLLVTLLRAAGIPARFHLAQVNKAAQWGVMPRLAYRFAPTNITHTWAEIHLDGHWLILEGVIMDKPYFLAGRQLLLESGRPLGYAIGLSSEVLVNCTDGRCIDWNGASDVTCQMTAMVADLGQAADPEEFYHRHRVTGLRGVLFERHISQEMTRRAECIRCG